MWYLSSFIAQQQQYCDVISCFSLFNHMEMKGLQLKILKYFKSHYGLQRNCVEWDVSQKILREEKVK